ncbi:hypothetical protein [Escherichia coli]|nr:hypothetical protein [Escherichia coli]VFT03806.1 Uncharacterised protein [Escherichia coli]
MHIRCALQCAEMPAWFTTNPLIVSTDNPDINENREYEEGDN